MDTWMTVPAACTMAVIPFGAYGFHHFGISHTYYIAVYMGTDPLPGYFLYCFHTAAVRFVRIRCTERSRDRMRGVPFYMGRQMEQSFSLISCGWAAVTWNTPLVRVPVLSKTTVLTLESVSR